MQTLDIISVNVWQILISLVNLLLLFLIIKKFLFKPVMTVLEKRRQEIDGQYAEADAAIEEANLSKKQWEEKLAGAEGPFSRAHFARKLSIDRSSLCRSMLPSSMCFCDL